MIAVNISERSEQRPAAVLQRLHRTRQVCYAEIGPDVIIGARAETLAQHWQAPIIDGNNRREQSTLRSTEPCDA
jgi:hypothetical protein